MPQEFHAARRGCAPGPSDRPPSNTSRSLLAASFGRGGAYNTAPLLRTEPGAHGYRLRFLEFDGVEQIGYETLIQLGEDTAVTPPSDIVLDRVYVHGHRWKGQKRGLTLNGVRLSLLSSYVSDIKAVNADSQGIVGYNGAGPLTIENNYIEAAAENILWRRGPCDHRARAVRHRRAAQHPDQAHELEERNSGDPGVRQGCPCRHRSAQGGNALLPDRRADDHRHTDRGVGTLFEVSLAVPAGRAVTLSWSAVSRADRDRIYRSTSAGAGEWCI